MVDCGSVLSWPMGMRVVGRCSVFQDIKMDVQGFMVGFVVFILMVDVEPYMLLAEKSLNQNLNSKCTL